MTAHAWWTIFPIIPHKQIELWGITSTSGNFRPYQIQTANIHFKESAYIKSKYVWQQLLRYVHLSSHMKNTCLVFTCFDFVFRVVGQRWQTSSTDELCILFWLCCFCNNVPHDLPRSYIPQVGPTWPSYVFEILMYVIWLIAGWSGVGYNLCYL